MTRSFVVVGESSAVVTDRYGRFVELDEMLCRHRGNFGLWRGVAKDRIKRILGQDVFDIGEKKFLMLLFVVQTQDEDRLDLREQRLIRVVEQLPHALIDRIAEAISLRYGRSGDQAP